MSYFLFLIKLSQLGVTLSRILSLSFSDSLCGLGLLDLSMIKNWGSHHNQRLIITLSGTMSKPVQLYQKKNACIDACMHAQSCPTICNPMDYSLPGSSAHGDSAGKNTGVGCHSLFQGIFPTQGLNPGLPYCRWFFTIWAMSEASYIRYVSYISTQRTHFFIPALINTLYCTTQILTDTLVENFSHHHFSLYFPDY